jgi:hypothetical protein
MRKIFLTFAFALVAVATVGCKKKLPECLSLCEQRAAELHCGRPYMCKEECEALAKQTVCKKELDAFAACFMVKPTSDWECDEQGKPAPKETVCVSERDATSACMRSEFTKPNPPKTL